MLTVFVVGNKFLEKDSMPVRIMQKLQQKFPRMTFAEFEPTENFPECDHLVFLDTVVGIEKVEIIDDINAFSMPKAYSLHDFDLGLNLKLLQKTGKIKSFKIIGVPPQLSEKEALRQVSEKMCLNFSSSDWSGL